LDAEDERWVVKCFINEIINEDTQRALRATRKGNKSITLLEAMEQLRTLDSPDDGSDIGFNHNADIETSAEQRERDEEVAKFISSIRYIVVRTMPHDILSNPVAFKQFLLTNNVYPSYDSSGPFHLSLFRTCRRPIANNLR
jgi:hypothetical protein